ncbi:MAG: endonuclease VIII [Prevotellaceae bacterium]|nr:endonuclease VIII [Prevotellaceae bacterium]
MLEFPEVTNISRQLQETVVEKTVRSVLPPTKRHKFCWFNGNPSEYETKIAGCKITTARGFGLFVEIAFDNGQMLCVDDGVNVRFLTKKETPDNFQLLIEFTDSTFLLFTVAMYGGIVLHDNQYDNEYYNKSKAAISPLSPNFDHHFADLLATSKPNLSTKAFIATEQRFPGIGNGVLQDILFEARIHPKRKIKSFGEEEKERLRESIVSVLTEMTENGGRDTEKDLFGNTCGYTTRLSKNTYGNPCPICGTKIEKEQYMGGSIYFCPECQKEV